MRRQRVGLVLLVAACTRAGSPPPDGAGAAGRPCPAVAAAAPGRFLDETFERLGEAVPGFAGFMLDGAPNPSVVVFLVDTALAPCARAAVPPVVAALGRGAAAARPIVVRPAKYSWRQLAEWGAALTPTVADGFRSVATSVARNRVELGVADAATQARVLAARARRRIPADAVVVTISRGGRDL